MNEEITLIEEWFISDENLHQVFAVGLVDSPAIEVDWKKFSKTKVEKFSIDKAKRILTGPLAIPNLEIYRSNPDRYIYFSQATIAKLAENFLKYSHQNTTTHNHIFNMPGNTVIESWLIEDPKADKATVLGYELPKGTWMISVKVGDEKYWNEFIETGILKGFSLEGNFDEKVVQMKEEKKDLVETPKKKRKNKWKNSMKKLLEFIKSMNFNADQTVADLTEELEAASLLLSFNEGERAIEIDEMFIGTYTDDMSFVTEGVHTTTSPDGTADYQLVFGLDGQLLNLTTPWGLMGSDEVEEVVETETELTDDTQNMGSEELELLKIENKNLEVKIAELTNKIGQMSKQTNKPVEVKNTVDKSKKVEDNKEYVLAGTLSRLKNIKK